ncbi:MAG: alpha/beta hydrolase [Bacteroidales bacterium]|nr:alpha/beta hydrolase [Bacteroidales bacterium]
MKYLLMIIGILALAGCTQVENQDQSVNSLFWGHRFSLANDIQYGDSTDQKLDIYSQGQWIGEPEYWKSDSRAHPTLIYIHGGGWLGGSKDQITPFIIPYLEKGWNVVTLAYRTGEGTAPQAVNDCMQAIQWTGRHAGEYNIDPHKLVISGESAGGHLALITGMLNSIPGSNKFYAGDSVKIIAIVNWFGISDISGVDAFYRGINQERNYASVWVGNHQRMDSISQFFSPVHRIGAATPPIITIHGLLDSVVPYKQAVTLHKLLQEKGIRNELVSIPQGKHLGFTEKDFQHIYTRIFDFLGKL